MQLRTLERQVAERLVPNSDPLPSPFLNILWQANQEHFEAISKTGARCKGRMEKAKTAHTSTARLLDLRCENLTTQLSGQRLLVYQQFQMQLKSVTEMNVKADLMKAGKRELCDGKEPCLNMTVPNVGALKIVEDRRTRPVEKPLASTQSVVLNLPLPGSVSGQGENHGNQKEKQKENDNQVQNENQENNQQENGKKDLAESGLQEDRQSEVISPISFPEDYGFQAQEGARF